MYDLVNITASNFATRDGQKPISIIVHSIGTSLDKAIEILSKPDHGVSSHYLIPQLTMSEFVMLYPQLVIGLNIKHPNNIPVIALVAEEMKAFHAGISSWKDWNNLPGCESGLNNCSIGIEFHAPNYALGDDSDMFHFTPYTDKQMQTGAALIKDICSRHNIMSGNILAHSDISFMRPNGMYKTDPGPLFSWKQLHQQHQLGFYPTPDKKTGSNGDSDINYLQRKLREIGYNCPQTGELDINTQYCINAYRMHFMHETWRCFDGRIDDNLVKTLHNHI